MKTSYTLGKLLNTENFNLSKNEEAFKHIIKTIKTENKMSKNAEVIFRDVLVELDDNNKIILVDDNLFSRGSDYMPDAKYIFGLRYAHAEADTPSEIVVCNLVLINQ